MLKQIVGDALKREFQDTVHVDLSAQDFAVFYAKHPSVGNVVVQEDYGELIVSVGDITHGHFGAYEVGMSEIERAEAMCVDVVPFLQDLFADRCLLFKARWGGGWTLVENVEGRRLGSPNRQWFNWSGPLHFDEEIN